MVLWFAVMSVLGVHAVFRDDRMDHRFVLGGALLPDAADFAVRQGVGPFHSVVVGVGLLFAVVLATIGRRRTRKRWLALPIGIFAHQILDGAWTDTTSFWWPLTGFALHGRLPVVTHGLAVGVVEEAIALAAGVWIWRSFGFAHRARRAAFLRTGHLPPRRPRRPSPRAPFRR